MTKLAARLILLAGLLAIVPGCVVLPVPNSRVEGYGVASQVVDADSGRPIAGATVIDTLDERRAVTTNAEGRFKLDPHVQWHFGYLCGVISYPIWPFTGDMVIPDRSIRVVADGYDEARLTLSSFPSTRGREDLRGGIPVQHDVFQIPSIPLRRPPSTQPLTGSADAAGPPAE